MRYTVDIDPCEVLGELDEETIVEHMLTLGYVVNKASTDGSSIKDAARDVFDELIRRRPERAREAMRSLLKGLIPPEIMEAHEALEAGDVSTAICRIDSFITPAPPVDVLAKQLRSLQREKA